MLGQIQNGIMSDQKQKLEADWFLTGRLDPEYKKYVLLAYLRQTERAFAHNELYPHLSELVFHYRNLKQFLDRKKGVYEQFPEELVNVDMEKLKLHYRKVIHDDALMESLEAIVQTSVLTIEPYLEEGKAIFDFIEKQVALKEVGLVSVSPYYGYLFIQNGAKGDTAVYYYQLESFTDRKQQFKSLKTRYLDAFKRKLSNTYEGIKKDLLHTYESWTNPASFAVESQYTFPMQETLLPISKRLLLRHLQQILRKNS